MPFRRTLLVFGRIFCIRETESESESIPHQPCVPHISDVRGGGPRRQTATAPLAHTVGGCGPLQRGAGAALSDAPGQSSHITHFCNMSLWLCIPLYPHASCGRVYNTWWCSTDQTSLESPPRAPLLLSPLSPTTRTDTAAHTQQAQGGGSSRRFPLFRQVESAGGRDTVWAAWPDCRRKRGKGLCMTRATGQFSPLSMCWSLALEAFLQSWPISG